MNKTTKRKILYFISSKIPLMTTVVIFITSFIFQPFKNIKILATLIPIFFWSSKQKAFFDFLPVLLFGFLQDFIDNTAFGINIFIFLTLYSFVSYQTFLPINTSFFYSFFIFSPFCTDTSLVLVVTSLRLHKYIFHSLIGRLFYVRRRRLYLRPQEEKRQPSDPHRTE